MSNIFEVAKKIRKNHPGKTWAQVVKIAAGKKSKPTTKSKPKIAGMATRKRKASSNSKAAPKRKRRVGAVTTTTRKTTTKRRSVGSIIDQQLPKMALGMALTGTVQGLLAPFRSRIPGQFAKLVDPAMVVLAYGGAMKFKNPIVKGVCLGLMKNGVDGTVGVVMAALGKGPQPVAPAVIAPPAQMQAAQYAGMPSVGASDFFIPINGVGSIGEIKDYLGTIEATIAGGEMGSYSDGNYLPLGFRS